MMEPTSEPRFDRKSAVDPTPTGAVTVRVRAEADLVELLVWLRQHGGETLNATTFTDTRHAVPGQRAGGPP